MWLSLYGNDLTGGIPTELTGLAKLKRLYLHENRNLGGTIPAELGTMSSLTHLLLLRTGLSGPIPEALGDLSNLEWLALYNNNLSGDIPSVLGRLTKLQRLYLHYNGLTGEIPSGAGRPRSPDKPMAKPESTEGGPWGQPLKKREGAPMNLG